MGHLAAGMVFGPGLVPFATEVDLGQVEGHHIPVVVLEWGLGCRWQVVPLATVVGLGQVFGHHATAVALAWGPGRRCCHL